MSRPVSRGQQALVNLTLADSPEAALLKEETEELMELFRLVDRDGGGTISMDEFLELLQSIRIQPTPHEMTLLFAEIDTNHNQLIELEEFMAFMQDTSIKQINPVDVIHAFEMFEGFSTPSQSGRLHMKDLLEAIVYFAGDRIQMQKQRSERGQSLSGSSGAASASATARRRSETRTGNGSAKKEVNEEDRKALQSLLGAIEWEADGSVDYAEFVRRNTNYKPPQQPQSSQPPQQQRPQSR